MSDALGPILTYGELYGPDGLLASEADEQAWDTTNYGQEGTRVEPERFRLDGQATGRSQAKGEQWPEMAKAAYHGLAGRVVDALAPETEADPAALLVTLLTMFGAAVGPGPHAKVGAVEHPARLFTVQLSPNRWCTRG